MASKDSIDFNIAELPKILSLVKDEVQQSQINIDLLRYLGCLALRKLLSKVDNPPYQ